jgi:uncharacterized protein YqgV (UPF0045/DUF77 family)
MSITAQVSLYPLQETFIPPIDAAIAELNSPELNTRIQPMSTMIEGETEEVFAALRRAFEAGAASGATIMVVTIANACLITNPY